MILLVSTSVTKREPMSRITWVKHQASLSYQFKPIQTTWHPLQIWDRANALLARYHENARRCQVLLYLAYSDIFGPMCFHEMERKTTVTPRKHDLDQGSLEARLCWKYESIHINTMVLASRWPEEGLKNCMLAPAKVCRRQWSQCCHTRECSCRPPAAGIRDETWWYVLHIYNAAIK